VRAPAAVCRWTFIDLFTLLSVYANRMTCHKPTTAVMWMMALLLGTAIALANANAEPTTFNTRYKGSYYNGGGASGGSWNKRPAPLASRVLSWN